MATVSAVAVASGDGAHGEVVSAANNVGSLARDELAFSRECRSGRAARARATCVADGLPLEDAGGENTERATGRRLHMEAMHRLSEKQRHSPRIDHCLQVKWSIRVQSVRCSYSHTGISTSARWRFCLAARHVQHQEAVPTALLEPDPDVPALQVTLDPLRGVVALVASHH